MRPGHFGALSPARQDALWVCEGSGRGHGESRRALQGGRPLVGGAPACPSAPSPAGGVSVGVSFAGVLRCHSPEATAVTSAFAPQAGGGVTGRGGRARIRFLPIVLGGHTAAWKHAAVPGPRPAWPALPALAGGWVLRACVCMDVHTRARMCVCTHVHAHMCVCVKVSLSASHNPAWAQWPSACPPPPPLLPLYLFI